MRQPPTAEKGAARCMKLALKDARMDPERVGYINAHGTSTKQGDIAETTAVKTVFGDHAKKSWRCRRPSRWTGHTLGAAWWHRGGDRGAGESERGILPPTVNLEEQTPSAISTTCRTVRARRRSTSPCRTTASASRHQLDAHLRPPTRATSLLMRVVVGSDHAATSSSST